MIDARFFPILDENLDHIEAPWQIPGAEAAEPGVCSALDQFLFGSIHGIQRPDFCGVYPCFYFYEEQEFAAAGDDVHLTPARRFEVPG